jgi:hypothetical protein
VVQPCHDVKERASGHSRQAVWYISQLQRGLYIQGNYSDPILNPEEIEWIFWNFFFPLCEKKLYNLR